MSAVVEPLLRVEGVRKLFTMGTSGFHLGRAKIVHRLHAVDDVSFTLDAGESVGLVGESGCGKSTLVRLLARLADPTEGGIRFEGRAISAIPATNFARAPERALIQMVFQDPTDSINPRFTAFDTIAEPLRRLAPPSDAAVTANPSFLRLYDTSATISGSSSTIRMDFMVIKVKNSTSDVKPQIPSVGLPSMVVE